MTLLLDCTRYISADSTEDFCFTLNISEDVCDLMRPYLVDFINSIIPLSHVSETIRLNLIHRIQY